MLKGYLVGPENVYNLLQWIKLGQGRDVTDQNQLVFRPGQSHI